MIDSFLQRLALSKRDTARIGLYADIMLAHVYYKPKQGLAYGKPALELATQLNWKPGIAKINHRKGRLFWRLGVFDQAIHHHTVALDMYQQLGDRQSAGRVMIEIGQDYLDHGKLADAKSALKKGLQYNDTFGYLDNMASAYNVLCYLYDVEGNSADATKTAYEYLKISKKMGDKDAIGHAAHMLASNYLALGNPAEAKKYFIQGLQVSEETGNKIDQIYFHTDLGHLHLSESKMDKSKQHFLKALALAKELNDAQLLAHVYQSAGHFYNAIGNYPESISHYRSAEAAYKSISNKQDLAVLYAHMGHVYITLQRFDLAKKAFDHARLLYDSLNSKMSMMTYFSGRARLDSATGNWQSAFKHFQEFVAIRDSSMTRESLQKLVGSQFQYENEMKEAAARAAQEKKDFLAVSALKQQRNMRNIAFVVLAGVLVFSFFAWHQRNKLAKEKRRSDQLLQDKELLLREIHHRVKNNLEIVSSLLALQSAQIDDAQTKDAMQESQNRVQSIGIVHQKLYQGSNLGAIEMKDYFINLSESILDSFGAEKRVTIECAMEQLDVDIDTAVPLGLIVNELLTNSLKYAFPDGQQGKVLIKLQQLKNGVLQLEVSDNGIGKSGITKGTGFGGQLVWLLTQQLGGTMKEEVHEGTSIYFEFKNGKAA